MKEETLGQVFKRYREAEELKIEQIEKETKISRRMLLALENDDYAILPDEFFTKNIIKIYAQFLTLDPNKLLALHDKNIKNYAAKDNLPSKSKPVKEILTPQKVKLILIGAAVLVLLGYMVFQINKVFEPPQLIIYSPDKDLAISENYIEISGKTEKEARVFINEKEIFLNYQGEFKAMLDLQKGMNLIKITAIKKMSKENTIYREILVQ
jgi:cytoskeletal protein RodZ